MTPRTWADLWAAMTPEMQFFARSLFDPPPERGVKQRMTLHPVDVEINGWTIFVPALIAVRSGRDREPIIHETGGEA